VEGVGVAGDAGVVAGDDGVVEGEAEGVDSEGLSAGLLGDGGRAGEEPERHNGIQLFLPSSGIGGGAQPNASTAIDNNVEHVVKVGGKRDNKLNNCSNPFTRLK
jgi:hypothetical protein